MQEQQEEAQIAVSNRTWIYIVLPIFEARSHTLDRKETTDCHDRFLESAIDNVLPSKFQLRREGMSSAFGIHFIKKITSAQT